MLYNLMIVILNDFRSKHIFMRGGEEQVGKLLLLFEIIVRKNKNDIIIIKKRGGSGRKRIEGSEAIRLYIKTGALVWGKGRGLGEPYTYQGDPW